VDVKGPRSYVVFPGVYLTPRNCLYAPRNRTNVSGSERTPRAKTFVPGAGRAVNRNVTDFVRVGMESVQVMYVSRGYVVTGRLTCSRVSF
jgi:hypothetical protein